MGRIRPTVRRGAVVGVIAMVAAAIAVVGVARSSPAQAGLARVDAVVCLDLDLSLAISVDASAMVALGDGVHHDHIAAAVRFRTDVGVVTDWQALPDSGARQFQEANGNHFDDTLVVAPVTAAVAVQVRLEAVGAWSDGTIGGLLELPWTPTPGCGPTLPVPPPPAPALGLPDIEADIDVDADIDVPGVIDLDADADVDVDLDLPSLPQLPVPVPVPVPTVPGPTSPGPTSPLIDLDADLDLDLDLGLLPIVVVGGPVTPPPTPPTPTDPSLIGIAARVLCGVGLDADVDLVLAGRPTTASAVVVTHPDSLVAIDVDLGASSTQVIPLLDVVLGHRVLNVLVDGVSIDVAVDLSCPIDLTAILTPTCIATVDGLNIHLASRLDATLALLLGVRVLDPVTGADVTAALQAGASIDLWLDGSGDGTVLEVHAQLLGIDLAVGLVTCTSRVVTPTTTTPTNPHNPTTTVPSNPNNPTTTVPANPNNPTTTVPSNPNNPTTTVPTDPNNPTTTITPGSADPDSPPGSADPLAKVAPASLNAAAPASTTTSVGSLPITGTSSLLLVAAAAALMAFGLVSLQLARRRRSVTER